MHGRTGTGNQEEYVIAVSLDCPDNAVVYLYLVNYGRAKPEEIGYAISGFLSVSQ
jgi:hypothetical protein